MRGMAASRSSIDRHIVAMGGAVLLPEAEDLSLERYILDLCGKRRPRVAFVPTASGDDQSYILRFYQCYSRLTLALSHLPFFRRTPADLRALVFEHDVIHIGGGNTKSMLAVWREYGFDAILREAWERGIVLCGSSAGSICWFEEGVTDSIDGPLTPLACLGFLAGSNCPHYDGEKDRRPAYTRMVRSGVLSDGYAADDGVGLHFINDRFHRAVSARPKSKAYRVERAGRTVRERALKTTYLGSAKS